MCLHQELRRVFRETKEKQLAVLVFQKKRKRGMSFGLQGFPVHPGKEYKIKAAADVYRSFAKSRWENRPCRIYL